MSIVRFFGAALTLFTVAVGSASAQDEGLEAKVEEAHDRYEQAWMAGDAEALVSMFADDAVYWPVNGGTFEGREEIREGLQHDPTPSAADINSTRVERIGDLILDIGTFTITLPEEQGGSLEGEYVAVTEETDGEIVIRRLIGFPARRPMQEQPE